MKTIIYRQLNMTNKPVEHENLDNLVNVGFFTLGVELTCPELAHKCHMSIDPQHDQSSTTKITSIEYAFNYHEYILPLLTPFDKIFMGTIRTDADSIGTMAILTMMLEHRFHLDGDIILRLKAIANSDRHGRENWNNKIKDYFRFENYNIFGLPSGLACMASDHTLDITSKVQNMIEYIITGNFLNMDEYAEKLNKKFKQDKDIKCNVLEYKKLSHVTSTHRGAVAYGYRYTPVVIASNPSFRFGKSNTETTGLKITIAQYDENYIDIVGLTTELNALEPGWGGSSIIIGSPQEGPTKLPIQTIINLTKKYLY